MNAKLTLRLDEHLIARAKAISKAQGKSVSQLVVDYFAALDAQTAATAPEDLTPGVRCLLGAIRGSRIDPDDYKEHLAEKHLGAAYKPSDRKDI
ncbi:hypothetical protein CKO31_15685 [Thiohalocapsa halophila]|uniref:Antitoxin n=1 Tax=Thiohalocapsa halophila TaxID=69359 RepID=A0ABS1CJP6_9GAMM|nr:DUF6364 family protein [Thiohalocapsa halophila]MBK1632152.1 hypothetical protein [Thiohalocapsa halophila]